MNDRDHIAISATAIDVAAAIAFCSDPAAGAIDVFLGVTRAETRDGRCLLALHYEAYPEMADRQLRELADTARTRWPVARCAVVHRTGRVAVGEPSVVVAVSTPHRADSFAACQFLIDSLKAVATIWKQEEWAGGATSWVEGNRPTSPSSIG